jgi:hypothetical protein
VTVAGSGIRALPRNQNHRDLIINPVKVAEAFWYLHTRTARAGHTSFS